LFLKKRPCTGYTAQRFFEVSSEDKSCHLRQQISDKILSDKLYFTGGETRRFLVAVKNSKNTQLKYIVILLLLLGCKETRSTRQPMGRVRPIPQDMAHPFQQVREKQSCAVASGDPGDTESTAPMGRLSVCGAQPRYPETACPVAPGLEQRPTGSRSARIPDA